MTTVKRRSLSGLYIFHKFEDEKRREPTCFEDCPEDKQDEWLGSLDSEAVKHVAKIMARTLRKIGDMFDITTEKPQDDTE